jgi:DNA-binding NarL/FixJ family response regulator
MPLGDALLILAERSAEANSRRALIEAAQDFIRHVGAQRFICAYFKSDPGGMHVARSIGNTPREWQEGYLQRGYEADDAVLKLVIDTGARGYWSDLMARAPPSPKALEVLAFAAQCGMSDGYTCRIALQAGGFATTMFAGRRLVRSARAAAAMLLAAQLLANEGARLITLAPAADGLAPPSLSDAQMQVLLLRAEGLANPAVAERLARDVKTIESHVTQILRRLEARNMVDAIRIARLRNLIPRA